MREKKAFSLAWILLSIAVTIASSVTASIYNFSLVGWFAVGSIVCYASLDFIVYWLEYIDYKTDDNSMLHWLSFGFRSFALLFLLITGAIYFSLIIDDTENVRQASAHVETAKAVSVTDKKLASSLYRIDRENAARAQKEKIEKSFALQYALNPLSKYAPAIIAIFGLLVITIASKLDNQSPTMEHNKTTRRIAAPTVPHRAIGFSNPAINGYVVKPQASGYRIYDSSGKNYLAHISHSKVEQAGNIENAIKERGL